MEAWKTGKLPVKAWVKNREDIEDSCLEQAEHLSNLPFAFHHVALMPDCHSGYGMPIGGVLATKDYIVPNAVGVDIGCGMVAIKTSIKEITIDHIKAILGGIRATVPVGFKHQDEKQPNYQGVFDNVPYTNPAIVPEINSMQYQLGTLGGGNHFIEIQMDTESNIWLMIHSGSRNLGKKVCDYYNKLAMALNKAWFSSVPKDWDLAFLPVNSDQGRDYLDAMSFCLRFAKANRNLMMDRVIEVFCREMNAYVFNDSRIDIHHNYAVLENHFGENVWMHRKGAIRVREGDLGIIPGSMGTASYIVRGLGNTDSFMSASHGAGRVMSRKKANETITEEMAQEAMKGVVYGRFNGKYDECPQAYKDINTVIANEIDLVTPVVKLFPLGVVKG